MITSSRTCATSSGVISGSGLAIAKMIGFGAIERIISSRERALRRQAEHRIGTLHGVGQRACVCLRRMGRFPLVHALGAAAVDHALGIAEHDVVGRKAHRLEKLRAGDAGGARAVDHELGLRHVAAGQMQGVDQARRGDDRGAVLVVMEDRNVHQLPQALLDDEAFRRLDVFQVDAAEGRPEIAHRS